MAFTALYRLKSLAGTTPPTYGNTMYHTGMMRIISETGLMPVYDLSYGGLTKSFYAPAYRLFGASLSVLSGLDPVLVAGMMVVAFGVVITLAAYLLGREFGGAPAGLAAAFLLALSPELAVYTMRPFPQLVGIAFLLLSLYFLKRGNLPLTIVSAVATALTHQTTAVALAATLLLYAVLGKSKKSAVALLAMAAAYSAWHFHSLGNLDILSMRQIALRESGAVSAGDLKRVGAFALLLAPFGIPRVLKERKNVLLACFVVASLLLAKNDLLGVGVFTTRFFTFFALSLIFLAGNGTAEIAKAVEAIEWR